jgi:hypothetical protein
MNRSIEQLSPRSPRALDVLTTEEAAKLLAPLIKPLPSFVEAVLQRKAMPR